MKVAKKLVGVILGLALVFSFSAVAFATGGGNGGAIQGKDVVLNNVQSIHTPNGDYVVITTKGKTATATATTRARPEKVTQQVFYHTIYDRNGKEIARLTSTVSGVYSEYDHMAMITDISGYFTGTEASNMSYSKSISGDTGTIYIHFFGAKIASISYRISINGNIQNI